MRPVGTVWLVGMMGAGKSSVGRLLARRLSRDFADTDEEIERRVGLTVAEIFAREGEPAFRAFEREAVRSHRAEASVVALGGGAIADPELRALVKASGTVVYLRAEPDTLLARLGDCASRPLLREVAPGARAARLRALLDERRAGYESACLIVDTDGLSPEAVAEAIASGLAAGPARARGAT